jgi:hypothetical protein
MTITYEEYFATDEQGNLLGYFKQYDEATAAINNNGQGKIYGAHWVKTKYEGLLQRVWGEIK